MLFGHMLVFIRGTAVRCEANVNIIEVEQKKNRTHTRGDMFTPEEKTFKSIMCEEKKKKRQKKFKWKAERELRVTCAFSRGTFLQRLVYCDGRWKRVILYQNHFFLGPDPSSCISASQRVQENSVLHPSRFSSSLITDCRSQWPDWTHDT